MGARSWKDWGCGLALALGLGAGAAGAEVDSCREWKMEHYEWKAEALGRFLRGAPQRELDDAIFELLQREAYLTSCDVSVRIGRDDLVGWRLVGRPPEEFGAAVAESVLDRAGFDVGLRDMFAEPARVEAPPGRVLVGSRVGPR